MTLSKQIRREYIWHYSWSIKFHNAHSDSETISKDDVREWIYKAREHCEKWLQGNALWYSSREIKAAVRSLNKCVEESWQAFEEFERKLGWKR